MNDDLSDAETESAETSGSAETNPTGLPSLEDALAERAEKLGEFIRDQRRIARLSLRKLSDMAQISNPYLSQIERGLRKPSADILQQLAKALRISAETLYVQAGILEERKDEPDLVSAIRREPTLTEAQKRALVQVLRSFQAENRVGGFGEQSS
jgi:transcriptional regulator with XRE-family HTH domain